MMSRKKYIRIFKNIQIYFNNYIRYINGILVQYYEFSKKELEGDDIGPSKFFLGARENID